MESLTEKDIKNKKFYFLQEGGEMGELTRNFNWAETSLGTPDTWPTSLQTTIGIILHSAFPMFLFWEMNYYAFTMMHTAQALV